MADIQVHTPNLMQQGNIIEAKKYFYEAMKINSDYPNTHFALGMIAEMENDLHSAFYSTIRAIQLNKSKDVLFQNSVKQAFAVSKKIIESGNGKKIYYEYRHKLEIDGGKEIEIFENSGIATAAKIEFAENYNRNKHIVYFKAGYPAVEHLIMHELVHLDFVIQARKEETNQIFYSSPAHKQMFITGIAPTIKKLKRMNIPEDGIAKYCTDLFNGINSQIFNAPVDLLIENFLYSEYAELRPYQFLSLYNMIQEGLEAVTNKKVVDLSPADILSKSKIYNLLNAMQFKELFGLDILKDFKASTIEIRQAENFYNEFIEYRDDKSPGEEYDLVQHWAGDLKLDKYFELEGETQFHNRSNINSFIENFEKDPLGIIENDPVKEREMKKFQKSQKEIGINMAVAMYMVGAMEYFAEMEIEDIRKIAYEIALQGTQGYNPDNKDYRINLMPGKVFSGYQILAYYYVSWMIIMPEMVPDLKLPYIEEYKMAKTLFRPNN